MEKKQPRVCTTTAPCKINLHLKIGDKRGDGFHSLESLFASLDFGDTLRFECTGEEGKLELSMDWETKDGLICDIPPETNLVFRAVSLFRERSGYKNGLRIHVIKRIPVGAGLGGGSSDAANCLLALNSLAFSPFSMEELSQMAAVLGSDVPFFLSGGAAFVSGRGEIVEPAKIPEGLWVILAKPPFSSETASAYALLDQAREAGFCGTESEGPSKETLLRSLKEDPRSWPFRNDFLPVFMNQPENAAVYKAILEALKDAGASFAGLSGAGACCFGVFTAKKTALAAVKALDSEILRRRPSAGTNFIKLTFFLAHKAIPVLE